MEKTRYCKTQAYFTVYFDSDFEPSVISKIIGIKAHKSVLRKDALRTHFNPNSHGFFQIATNVGEDRNAETAVKTILKPFIKHYQTIRKMIEDNNGYCCLDLFVHTKEKKAMPTIELSPNVIELLNKLKAVFSVNII